MYEDFLGQLSRSGQVHMVASGEASFAKIRWQQVLHLIRISVAPSGLPLFSPQQPRAALRLPGAVLCRASGALPSGMLSPGGVKENEYRDAYKVQSRLPHSKVFAITEVARGRRFAGVLGPCITTAPQLTRRNGRVVEGGGLERLIGGYR